jgi:DNA-binding NarL/FixJ family response regulator
MPISKVLVVEGYEPLRRLVCSVLQVDHLHVIGEASDGLEAVQKAKRLQPDLILMDLNLLKLNGFQAAREIFRFLPHTKIVFLSDESCPEVIAEAFKLGASGYVHKLQSYAELLLAIEKALRRDWPGAVTAERRHEIVVCSDESVLIQSFSQFVANALEAGSPAIVVATKPQLVSISHHLTSCGLDAAAAEQSQNLFLLDVGEALSRFSSHDSLDAIRVRDQAGDMLDAAARVAHGARLAACGVCAPMLWARGKKDEAVLLESVWEDLSKAYGVDILCGYPASVFPGHDEPDFQSLSAQHTAVYSR